MSRNSYIGLLVVMVIIGIAIFSYKTDVPLAAQTDATAKFGGVSLRIDYATTKAEREKGLGGQSNIQSDYGMIFIFSKDDYYGFWMKDMFVPIDIFWLDNKGQVVSIAQNVATSTYPNVFYPLMPARYVLETIAGFAHTHNIATGTSLLLKNSPSVSE